jgi:phosphatidylethanolamine-binding protein (PEBP) family uncharacterized protein
MRRIFAVLTASLLLVSDMPAPAQAISATTVSFSADVWADNWFAMYVNGVKVAVDPVPITTTKSFNKVSVNFKAKYPLTVAIIAKDYVENKSGLEYIGTPQQQIGDAGLVAQIHQLSSGKLVGSTSKSWKSLVVFKAPINPDCVKSSNPLADCQSKTLSTPANWYSSSFNDKSWTSASQYTEAQVGVKDGYNEVNWDENAKLIWSSSLTTDNTVLFRSVFKAPVSAAKAMTLSAPKLTDSKTLAIDNSCDGVGIAPTLAWSNIPAGTKSLALTFDTVPGPARPGEPALEDFNHLVIYNIASTAVGLDSKLTVGTLGKNFKGSLGYTPPCSQGPGQKEYTFNLYAVSAAITQPGLTGPELLNQINGKILGTAKLTVYYTRKS